MCEAGPDALVIIKEPTIRRVEHRLETHYNESQHLPEGTGKSRLRRDFSCFTVDIFIPHAMSPLQTKSDACGYPPAPFVRPGTCVLASKWKEKQGQEKKICERERKQERKREREQGQGRSKNRNDGGAKEDTQDTDGSVNGNEGSSGDGNGNGNGARMDTGLKTERVTRIKSGEGGGGLLDPLHQKRSRAEDQALLFRTQHNLSGDRRLRLHVGKSFGRKTRRLYKIVASRGEPGHRDEREENVAGTGMGSLTGTARKWDWC